MARLIIPTPLRKFTGNKAEFETNSGTVIGAIDELLTQYPALQKQLKNDDGKLRSFVRIFVGEDDINSLDQELTKIEARDVVSIIPAIAGGSY